MRRVIEVLMGLAIGVAACSNGGLQEAPNPRTDATVAPSGEVASATATATSSAPQAPAERGAKDEHDGLRVSLADVHVTNGELLAGFVLRNVGSRPIHVYERWNSWGAYQWSLTIELADGQRVLAVNPQQAWTKNFPSALVIQPGKEHRLDCIVVVKEPVPWKPGLDYFVTKTPFGSPKRVLGAFSSTPDPKADPVGVRGAEGGTIKAKDMWSGSIETAWVEVK